MFWRLKNWIIDVTTPWHEERASLDLAWRIFAQKHNAAGKRPMCWYNGIGHDPIWELDPMEKVKMMDLEDPPLDPDYLIAAHEKAAAQHTDMERKANEENDALL